MGGCPFGSPKSLPVIRMKHLPFAGLWVLAMPLCGGFLHAEEAPSLFAMCHDTHDAGKRTLVEQAEMLAELGFHGAGHLWFGGVEERLKTLDQHEMKLFQIYERLDFRGDPSNKHLANPLSHNSPSHRQKRVVPLTGDEDINGHFHSLDYNGMPVAIEWLHGSARCTVSQYEHDR